MILKKARPLIEVSLLALLFFILHKLYFVLPSTSDIGFYYSIETIYGFFFAASLMIIFILMVIKQKNIDSVGHVFLLITSLKIVGAYFLLRQIIINGSEGLNTEKLHFYIVFAVFLTIETVVTIRILNKKQ